MGLQQKKKGRIMSDVINIFEMIAKGNYSSSFWLLLIFCALRLIVLPVIQLLSGFFTRLYEWRSYKRYLSAGYSEEAARSKAKNTFRDGERDTLTSRLYDRLFLYYIKHTSH